MLIRLKPMFLSSIKVRFTVTNTSIKQHIEEFPHYEEFAKIAQRIGFSKDKANELYSTYRAALEADFQSELANPILASKTRKLT